MAECENCGAPDDGEHVLCKFCKSPISKDLLTSAIECPTCKAPNRPGRTNCSACNGSLLRTCIFCGHQSPASLSDCQKCNEAFAGAEERKKKQGTEHMLGAVGNFVTNLVGAASGGGGNVSANYASSGGGSVSTGGGSSGTPSWSTGGGGGGGSNGGAPPMDE